MKLWSFIHAQAIERILTAFWAGLSAVFAAQTGGLESPYLGLLAAGPLMACAAGRAFLALEALFLAAIIIGGLALFGAENSAAYSDTERSGMALSAILVSVLAGIAGFFLPKPASAAGDPALAALEEAERVVEAANRRAEEAEETLSGTNMFYAALGHDLRTPLNAILGYSDMMSAEMLGPLPETYKDYAKIINDSGQDLLLLVDDILDLSKAQANRQRLELEPIDLTAIGEAVLNQLSGVAERSSVELKLASAVEVWAQADARAIRQIWQNLVSNAIKYSGSGGVVILKTAQTDGATSLSVSDSGVGMSEDDLAIVRNPFGQGANAKGRAGTGLGLTVVDRFAALHGGRMDIDSRLGVGTRVTVTLPAADPADVAVFDEAAE